MKRRGMLTGLLGLGALAATKAVGLGRTSSPVLLLQDTRIAGSAYYQLDALLLLMRQGDSLRLQRQTDNRYDERAVEVFWKQCKLGYLPRSDNAAVASLLDRQHSLRAEVRALPDRKKIGSRC